MELKEIEQELGKILQTDRQNWVTIYDLMCQVEQGKLWQGVHHSFTAWVRFLANTNHVHESLLWKRKKEGEIYKEYESRAKQKNKIVPKMQDLKVSPDNLELIDKIAQSNDSVKDNLIDKLLNNDIKRRDLKNAWQTVREQKQAKNQKAVKVNSHDKIKQTSKAKQVYQTTLKAIDIVLALNNPDWLDSDFNITRYSSKYNKKVYSEFTEFAVYTGSSRYSRRIDVMIIENMTAATNYELNLHGIEIKVSKNDLLKDKKMGEYTEYCDYFWLAIPESLLEEAKEIILPNWGIIIVKETQQAKIYQVAKKNDAIFKKESLTTALLKVL